MPPFWFCPTCAAGRSSASTHASPVGGFQDGLLWQDWNYPGGVWTILGNTMPANAHLYFTVLDNTVVDDSDLDQTLLLFSKKRTAQNLRYLMTVNHSWRIVVVDRLAGS